VGASLREAGLWVAIKQKNSPDSQVSFSLLYKTLK